MLAVVSGRKSSSPVPEIRATRRAFTLLRQMTRAPLPSKTMGHAVVNPLLPAQNQANAYFWPPDVSCIVHGFM